MGPSRSQTHRKHLYINFNSQAFEIAGEMAWIWLRWENLKIENKIILIILNNSWWLYVFFWISFTFRPYHLSLLICPLDGKQFPHRADECKYFRARLTLVCTCVEVHRRTSFMRLSLLLQQDLTFFCLSWIVSEMGDIWL